MTSTAPGVRAGGRWHTPTAIPRPTERCRRSLPAGGAASRHRRSSINNGFARLRRAKFFESAEVLIIQKAAQLAAAARVLELAQRLGLDLADALARHRELLADLFQRVVGIHADAEAHAQHALFAWRQGRQDAGGGLAQIGLNRGVDRQDRVLVLDEIAEVGVLLVADRSFQRQRLLGDLEHLAHFLEGHAEFLGKLLGRGLAADLIEHLARLTHDFVDGLDHVHGDADGARLVGGSARDRLPSLAQYAEDPLGIEEALECHYRNTLTNGMSHPEADGTSFTFLGFTHIWGKSRAGKNVVRQVTAKNRYARALAAVSAWCRINRHQSIPESC